MRKQICLIKTKQVPPPAIVFVSHFQFTTQINVPSFKNYFKSVKMEIFGQAKKNLLEFTLDRMLFEPIFHG
jgi:hypothetical protein